VSLRVLVDRTAQICAITTLFMTVISIGVAPDVKPGPGTWLTLLAIAGLSLLAVVTYVASRPYQASHTNRHHYMTSPIASAILALAGLSLLAVVTYVASRSYQASPATRQHRLTAAMAFAVIALLLNLFFGFWSTALLAAAIITLARQARTVRAGSFPWIMCAT